MRRSCSDSNYSILGYRGTGSAIFLFETFLTLFVFVLVLLIVELIDLSDPHLLLFGDGSYLD